jgi:hypothetical protein
VLAIDVVAEQGPEAFEVARAGRERQQRHVVLAARAPVREAAEHHVEARREVLRLTELGEVVVEQAHHRACLVDRQARLALAPDAPQQQHERHRVVTGLLDQRRVAKVRLAVGEVARVDRVETAAPVEQDALEREPVLGAEVLHLRRQVDAHAEVLARRVGGRERELPALVELVQERDGEVERGDAQPVGEHRAARLGQHEDVREVDDAQVGRVGRVHHHAAVAHAADRARLAVARHQQEVAGEGAGGERQRRVREQHPADHRLGLHLARRAEDVPQHAEGPLELGVVGVLDRLDLVLARLALDHLHHVLRVEVLQAEADAGAELAHGGAGL